MNVLYSLAIALKLIFESIFIKNDKFKNLIIYYNLYNYYLNNYYFLKRRKKLFLKFIKIYIYNYIFYNININK